MINANERGWADCIDGKPTNIVISETMTQDERWMMRYNEVMGFLEKNHRNPSRHRLEEHDMLNWLKANRKAINAGKMKDERLSKFKELLALMEKYKHVNQYV